MTDHGVIDPNPEDLFAGDSFTLRRLRADGPSFGGEPARTGRDQRQIPELARPTN